VEHGGKNIGGGLKTLRSDMPLQKNGRVEEEKGKTGPKE